ALEEKGKFRVGGAISIERRALRGAIQLGIARKHLDWLPNREEVFSRQRDGYLWTSVHLSGTIDQPRQDLSPRIIELFKESPGAGGFGCKIRLECTAQVFCRHPTTGINESDDYVCIVPVGANAQGAMTFHGFEAVFNHIIKRLLHLPTIQSKQRQVGAQFLFD